jgi:AbiEi antitoxin C-terminal domain
MNSEAALRHLQSRARYLFSLEDFTRLTGRESRRGSARSSLARLEARKLVSLVHQRPSLWVIVPPEHLHYGAPPVNWWLPDCMARLAPDYYTCLLSAARHWGSSHYAVQVHQVMVPACRPDIVVGRQRVTFFTKSEIERTPVLEVASEVSKMRVSTREATLLDLMRHQVKVGGVEAIARIAWDFAPELSRNGMLTALDAMGQVTVVQRLGFLFDRLGMNEQATLLFQWLAPRRRVPRALSESLDQRTEREYDARWQIKYLNEQLDILDEIR